jgi:hypothetical protein
VDCQPDPVVADRRSRRRRCESRRRRFSVSPARAHIGLLRSRRSRMTGIGRPLAFAPWFRGRLPRGPANLRGSRRIRQHSLRLAWATHCGQEYRSDLHADPKLTPLPRNCGFRRGMVVNKD